MSTPVGRNTLSTRARAVSRSAWRRSRSAYVRTLIVSRGSVTASCAASEAALTATTTQTVHAVSRAVLLPENGWILNIVRSLLCFALLADARNTDKARHDRPR